MIIERVEPNSRAEDAGLKAGDYLVTYQGHSLSSPWAFLALQENTFGVERITLGVKRASDSFELSLPVGVRGLSARYELPDDIQGGYERGQQAFDASRFAEAAEVWNALVAGTPDAGIRAYLFSKVGAAWERLPDWGKAHDAYLSAVTALEGNPDSAAQTALWRALGKCSNRLTEFSEAEQWYRRAIEADTRAGRPRWGARALFELGEIVFHRDDHITARSLYEQGFEHIVSYVPDSAEAALCLAGIGNSILREDAEKAEQYFIRAVEMAECTAPDSLEMAFVLNQAVEALQFRDLDAAQVCCERAFEITERLAPDSLDMALSLAQRAQITEWRGDLGTAMNYHRRALSLRERFAPGSRLEAVCHNDLANPLSRTGDFASARYHYKRSLEIMQGIAPESRSVADIFNNLGNIGDDPSGLSAEQCYRRSLEILERVELDSIRLLYPCANLGGIAFRKGDMETAKAYFTRSLRLCERISPEALLVTYPLAGLFDVARAEGDLAIAQEYLARILQIRARIVPDSLLHAEALHGLGEIVSLQGDLKEAHDHFLQTVEILERRRGELGSIEARALLMGQYQQAYASLLKSHLALGDIEGAFYTIERARARSFLELLAERHLDFSADAPPELLERQLELDQRRSRTYEKLSAITPTTDNAALIESLHTTLQQLERERERLTAEIRATSPHYANLKYPEVLGLAAARKELEPGTLLLSYFVGVDETILFAVTADSLPTVHTLPLGRDVLQERVNAFRRALNPQHLEHNMSKLFAEARQLYHDLLKPARAAIRKATRLLLCPDGPLHILPFAALVTNADRPVRYLGVEKALHSILSVTIYAQTRQQETKQRGEIRHHLLVVGDPLYSPNTVSLPPMKLGDRSADPERAQLRGLSFKPLPHSRVEALSLGELFRDSSTVRLGAEATKTAVLNDAPDANLLHFACHGWLDSQTPLSSGLALSQPEALGEQAPYGDNGLLQVWEIFQKLKLKADLVTLSACQTGLGQEIPGEGLVGLTRAFQYAGARSLIVSLLDINDASTVRFMQAFYAALKVGHGKDEALQAGVRALKASVEWDHPFYWSAFLLIGDRH